jgi:EmrB/QacA subfamily drug resistance transporter
MSPSDKRARAAGIPPGAAPAGRVWLLLTLLCTAEFVTILDFSIATVALPAIDADLGLSESALPWVINAYGVAIAGLLLLGGRMADVLGRREVFAVGMALFTAGSLVGGFAESPALLIAMRATQGVGAALVTPAALSIITTSFDDAVERNRALGVWGAVGASALAAGLILGAVITDALGWRWILWVNVPVGVVALLLTPGVLPRCRRESREALDLPGAGVALAGLVALVYGVGRVEDGGLASIVTLALIAGGIALLGAFLLVERVVSSPLAPPALIANRSVLSANLVSLAANGAFAGAFVLVSLHLQLVLDLGALATGLVLVPMALSVAVGAGAASSRLVARFGARAVIAGGMSTAAAGLAGLGLALDESLSWAFVLPGSVAAGLGYGIAFPAWTIVGVERVPDERQGVASGLLVTTQEVGAATGFAVMVAIAAAVAGGAATPDASAEGYRWAILAAALIAAAGAVLSALTPRPEGPAPARDGALGGARVPAAEAA